MQFYERRQRKDYFGEMIQLDGSPQDWFEGRWPRCTRPIKKKPGKAITKEFKIVKPAANHPWR